MFRYSPIFSNLLFVVVGFQVKVLRGLFYLGSMIKSPAARQQSSCSGFDYRWVLSLSLSWLRLKSLKMNSRETYVYKPRFYIFPKRC
jgi:hypothetical protein